MEPAIHVLNRSRSLEKLENITQRIQRCWTSAVGKNIAAHSRVLVFRGNTVVVAVDDATWKKQLDLMRAMIRERLVEITGIASIRQVQFQVSPARRPPVTDSTPLLGYDEADRIADPTLRKIYKVSRRKVQA
jgi:hypothetical protein